MRVTGVVRVTLRDPIPTGLWTGFIRRVVSPNSDGGDRVLERVVHSSRATIRRLRRHREFPRVVVNVLIRAVAPVLTPPRLGGAREHRIRTERRGGGGRGGPRAPSAEVQHARGGRGRVPQLFEIIGVRLDDARERLGAKIGPRTRGGKRGASVDGRGGPPRAVGAMPLGGARDALRPRAGEDSVVRGGDVEGASRRLLRLVPTVVRGEVLQGGARVRGDVAARLGIVIRGGGVAARGGDAVTRSRDAVTRSRVAPRVRGGVLLSLPVVLVDVVRVAERAESRQHARLLACGRRAARKVERLLEERRHGGFVLLELEDVLTRARVHRLRQKVAILVRVGGQLVNLLHGEFLLARQTGADVVLTLRRAHHALVQATHQRVVLHAVDVLVQEVAKRPARGRELFGIEGGLVPVLRREAVVGVARHAERVGNDAKLVRAARASEVGRDGRAMPHVAREARHRLVPEIEVERGGVVRSAHAHAAGREGPENGGSVEEPRDVRAARELVVARPHRDPRGIVQLETCRVGIGGARVKTTRIRRQRGSTRVPSRARTHRTPLYAARSSMDVPPFFGMWMNTGPACIASGRASAPRSVTGTGPVGRKPANATPTAAAPAAYLAMRAYRDESHAPSRSDAAAPSGLRPAARASSGSRSLTARIALCRADRPEPRGYNSRARRVVTIPSPCSRGGIEKWTRFRSHRFFLSIITYFTDGSSSTPMNPRPPRSNASLASDRAPPRGYSYFT